MAQTIGERTEARRARICWADLRDSSCEDLLDSQPAVPAAPLHDDTYIETPEPSFDHPQGSILMNLGRATALDEEELPPASSTWQPNAAAPTFVPTFQPAAGINAAAPTFVQTFPPAAGVASSSSGPSNQEGTASLARHRFRHKRPSTGALGSRLASKRPRQGSGQAGNGTLPEAAAAASESTAGGQQNPDDIPAGGVSEEDWQRRHEKRVNVITGIRSTLEYETMAAARSAGKLGASAPTTPDPHDRRISKRKWETTVMQWRNDLRGYTRAPGSSPERTVILPTLD